MSFRTGLLYQVYRRPADYRLRVDFPFTITMFMTLDCFRHTLIKTPVIMLRAAAAARHQPRHVRCKRCGKQRVVLAGRWVEYATARIIYIAALFSTPSPEYFAALAYAHALPALMPPASIYHRHAAILPRVVE